MTCEAFCSISKFLRLFLSPISIPIPMEIISVSLNLVAMAVSLYCKYRKILQLQAEPHSHNLYMFTQLVAMVVPLFFIKIPQAEPHTVRYNANTGTVAVHQLFPLLYQYQCDGEGDWLLVSTWTQVAGGLKWGSLSPGAPTWLTTARTPATASI